MRQLKESRPAFVSRKINTHREVLVYDKTGSRYFHAWRVYSGSRVYGNPSCWRMRYGEVKFAKRQDPMGGIYYEWVNGTSFFKSFNGTLIRDSVNTKREVLETLNAIGIFKLD